MNGFIASWNETEMQYEIDKLEIRNGLYELGLTVKDINLLKKKAEEYSQENSRSRTNRYVLKRKDNTYGVSEGKIIIKTNIPLVPSTEIHTTLFPFEIGKDDARHIGVLLYKFREGLLKDTPTHQIQDLTTIAKIKTAIKDELAHNYYELKSFEPLELISFCWLFDQSHPNPDYDDKSVDDDYDIKKIIKVLEYKNYRFSIMKRTNSYYSIKRFHPGNPEYNYIDEGRLVFRKNYIWNDLNEKDIETEILTKCSPRYEFMLVDKDLYERTKKRHKLKTQKEKEEEELSQSIDTAFVKRLKNLEKEPIEINGITFKHNGIFYEGQEISGTFGETDKTKEYGTPLMKDFKDFIGKADIQKGDFNTLYESFVEELEEREFDGILGQITVRVMKETTVNTKGTNVSRYHINGIRINKDEIVEMLKRAICFDNVDDYNDLLEKVCKCNLKFHDILSGGLDIEFEDDHTIGGTGHLKLKIVRKQSHNYLVLGKEEYKIKNTNRLISKRKEKERRRGRPQFEELVGMFKDLFEFDQKQLIVLFKDGMKEYKEAVKKSEQFLAETLKLFKVSKAEKDGESGYLIKGTSGKRYLLTDKLKIFDYDTMKYICIVDKDLKGGFKNDKIVSRIYALANDSRVAKHIYTLKGKE